VGFVRVCALDDLWEGEMESFDVAGQEVLLVRIDEDQVHAFQGACPHQDIALVEGKFDGKLLICRAHQWIFDAATGESVNPTNCRLAEYPLKIDGGDVLVDTEGVTPTFAAS
jgi:toluene monooxygenase system ferredoxin subunit